MLIDIDVYLTSKLLIYHITKHLPLYVNPEPQRGEIFIAPGAALRSPGVSKCSRQWVLAGERLKVSWLSAKTYER